MKRQITQYFPLDVFGTVSAPVFSQLLAQDSDKRKRKSAFNTLTKMFKSFKLVDKSVEIEDISLCTNVTGQIGWTLSYHVDEAERDSDRYVIQPGLPQSLYRDIGAEMLDQAMPEPNIELAMREVTKLFLNASPYRVAVLRESKEHNEEASFLHESNRILRGLVESHIRYGEDNPITTGEIEAAKQHLSLNSEGSSNG